MKEFVLQRAGGGDQGISKFLCDTQLNLSLVFQDYLVYEFSVTSKILVTLDYIFLDHLRLF